jgi:hypothetical protein
MAYLGGFMIDMNSLLKNIGSIAIPAMRTFAMTFVFMLLLGIILAVPSFAIASKAGVGWGALAGFLAIGVTGCLGVLMSQKRAIASGLTVAVEKYQAGSQTVQLIFSQIPQMENVQGITSLLPLSQAESIFMKAISDTFGATAQGGGIQGFIKRKIQENLLEKVKSITMPQFRAAEGGVDLLKIRDVVAVKADAAVIEKLTGMKSSANLLIVIAIMVSLLLAFLIRYVSTQP